MKRKKRPPFETQPPIIWRLSCKVYEAQQNDVSAHTKLLEAQYIKPPMEFVSGGEK